MAEKKVLCKCYRAHVQQDEKLQAQLHWHLGPSVFKLNFGHVNVAD
jgi:hypothetical protein